MSSEDRLSQLDPELEAIFQKHGRPKALLPERDIMPVYRRIFAAGTARFMSSPFVRNALSEMPGNSPDTHDIEITMRDGAKIEARVYRPTGSRPCPVMVMSHGGGWCMGGLDTEQFICQLLCRSLDLAIISVAYRLCPEVSYPTPVLDVYDAVKWVAANASTFGGDLKQGFLLCGISGGGNLTTGVSYLARDEGLDPPLTGSVLCCTGMPHESEDRHGNAIDLYPGSCPSWNLLIKDAPLCNYEANTCYKDLADPDVTSPLFTPLHYIDHSGLPPLYYQVAGTDPWRDSAFLYSKLLREAGCQTKLEIYPGVPHCWFSVYPQLSITKRWVKDTVEGVRWLLRHSDTGGPVSARL